MDPIADPEDVASRRAKRLMACGSLFLVLLADLGVLLACLIDPAHLATVTKLDSLIVTTNGLVGGLVGAYMGFSYQAQWRRSAMTYGPGAYPGAGYQLPTPPTTPPR